MRTFMLALVIISATSARAEPQAVEYAVACAWWSQKKCEETGRFPARAEGGADGIQSCRRWIALYDMSRCKEESPTRIDCVGSVRTNRFGDSYCMFKGVRTISKSIFQSPSQLASRPTPSTGHRP